MTFGRPARLAAGAVFTSWCLIASLVTTASADPTSPAVVRSASAHTSVANTTAYNALAPCRLLDSRETPTPAEPDLTVTVPTTGRCEVPQNAAAVMLTITVTDPQADGYVTAWPSGTDRPATSIVNFRAGETRANGAIVSVGADGALLLVSSALAHVVVDVTGAFTPASASRAGRFIATTPARVLDTRTTTGRLLPQTAIAVPLPAGVPADAVALSVSITTADSVDAGFLTTARTGEVAAAASVLNTDAAGQIRSTGQIVPVGPDGFTVFSQTGEYVIVDVNGWFTGSSAAMSSTGLFVPATPTRLADTRGGAPLYPTGTMEFDPTTVTGGPVIAIAANWTMVSTWDAGYLTAYPAHSSRPVASTANADRRHEIVSQFGITATSAAGIDVYSSAGSDLVVDVTGWFVGPPLLGWPVVSVANTSVADLDRRVLLIGDSTLAGVRWYTSSQHALGGSDFVLDAESCRRLIGTSCWGREKRTPTNALTAITNHEGAFETIVIMTGYNDWVGNFSEAFDQVVAASRAKGATEILWLTYREGTTYRNPSNDSKQDQGLRQQNAILYEKVASGAYADVRILNYNAYTAPTAGWFTKDGVHFTLAGAYGTADYISRQIAFGHREPCPAPWAPGEAVEFPCSDPDAYPGAVDPMTLYAGNPNDIHCYDVGADHHVNCKVDKKL